MSLIFDFRFKTFGLLVAAPADIRVTFRLTQRDNLFPKQGVTGSSPVTRSRLFQALI